MELIRVEDKNMWKDRKVKVTHSDTLALSLLHSLFFLNYDFVNLKCKKPMFIPCNVAHIAETIVLWMRAELDAILVKKEVDKERRFAACRRIKLLTQTTKCKLGLDQPELRWISEFLRNPNCKKTLQQCDILVSTTAMQAGVSIEDWFVATFCFFYNSIGTWEATFQMAERLRMRPGHSLNVYMYISEGIQSGIQAFMGHLLGVAREVYRGKSPFVQLSYAVSNVKRTDWAQRSHMLWSQWVQSKSYTQWEVETEDATSPRVLTDLMNAYEEEGSPEWSYEAGDRPEDFTPLTANQCGLACGMGRIKSRIQTIPYLFDMQRLSDNTQGIRSLLDKMSQELSNMDIIAAQLLTKSINLDRLGSTAQYEKLCSLVPYVIQVDEGKSRLMFSRVMLVLKPLIHLLAFRDSSDLVTFQTLTNAQQISARFLDHILRDGLSCATDSQSVPLLWKIPQIPEVQGVKGAAIDWKNQAEG